MKNIHLIPTDKPSRLVKIKDNLFYTTTENIPGGNYQNIYITSDEEVKEGDWVMTNGGIRFVTTLNKDKEKTFTDDGILSKQPPSPYCYLEHYKKIILTDNKSLIKDGVQSIDDEFLEWFVKNPSCEWVELEIDLSKHNGQFQTKYGYKIIIPSENPKFRFNNVNMEEPTIKEIKSHKEEPKDVILGYKTSIVTQILDNHILEEISEQHVEFINENIEEFDESLKSFKEKQKEILIEMMRDDEELGLYDESERRYSEEEVEEIAKYAYKVGKHGGINETYYEFKEWFEQFKKTKL